MTWIATFTGRKVNPCNLRPEDVCIEDVAHHLSLINRFTGASSVPYSVAEHSLRMSYLVPQDEGVDDLRLEALLHDATEAYLTDISRPVKAQLHNYANMEEKAEIAIRKAFGLPGRKHPHVLKQWDNSMLVWEARDLGIAIEEKYSYLDVSHLPTMTPLSWGQAERSFLDRYEELTGGR